MPVRLSGATSGYVELSAPAVAGSTSLELPTDSIKPGMVLVAAESFSGVSTVSVNNCFTATYANYQIVISATGSTNGAGGVATKLRMRAAGTDYTTGLYYGLGTYSAATGGPSRYWDSAQTSLTIGWHYDNGGETRCDIAAPFTSGINKFFVSSSFGAGGGDAYAGLASGQLLNTASYDGVTVFQASGTFTGNIRIYGYRNSL